jgi:hypothetical protein
MAGSQDCHFWTIAKVDSIQSNEKTWLLRLSQLMEKII